MRVSSVYNPWALDNKETDGISEPGESQGKQTDGFVLLIYESFILPDYFKGQRHGSWETEREERRSRHLTPRYYNNCCGNPCLFGRLYSRL